MCTFVWFCELKYYIFLIICMGMKHTEDKSRPVIKYYSSFKFIFTGQPINGNINHVTCHLNPPPTHILTSPSSASYIVPKVLSISSSSSPSSFILQPYGFNTVQKYHIIKITQFFLVSCS